VRQIEEVAAAPHPLAIVAVDMDADQPLGPDSGVLGDQSVEGRAQPIDLACRQAVLRDHDPALAILLDLPGRQARHDGTPPSTQPR